MDVNPSPAGFGHSRRRILVELAVLVGGLAALVLLSFWLASAMAATLVRFVPRSADVQLGEPVWRQLAPEAERCTDREALAYLAALTAPLVAQQRDFDYRFALVDQGQVNAFALPGGFVTVDLALVRKAERGEEIAGVLAHEMQHVARRHGMTRILRSAGGRVILGQLIGWSDVGALAEYAGGLVDLGYDRDQEREADAEGRALLMKAGIDPTGLSTFFARMAAEGGVNPPLLLSTHPSHEERAAAAASPGFTPTVALPPPPAALSCR